MRMTPLPIVGGAYADEARPWSVQDVCNWIPAQAEAEGTRTPAKYATPPGLRPFVQAGSGVVRGIVNCNGRLFAVIGNTLYQISNTGVAIPRGTIPGAARVVFAFNQITGGNQLLVINGSAGYVYNTVTETLAKITDPGYPGAITAAFADGFLVQIEPGRRFAFHSEIADALEYNTLNRFTSEVNPDPLVGLAFSNNELLLLSTETGEFFENTGTYPQPFRSKRISIDKGCAGTHTIAMMDNTVLWLGNDGKFYMLAGYTPQRISTRPIEQAIRGLNWSQAFAYVWEDSGHSVCYWTFPDGMTWGFDVSTGKWHRRASYGLNRWRVNNVAFWQQGWIAGDFQTGRLWALDWEYQLEGDQEIEREATTGVTHDNQTRVLMPRMEVVLDVGQEPTVPIAFPEQPVGPQIEGDAPDGDVDEPYSYTYATTAGDSPIVRTIIVSGQLLPGLSWNQSTATISGTPTESGPVNLVLRTIDANGLPAELSDSFEIYQTLIACSVESQYAGGQNFPTVVNVTLGTGLGWVELEFVTGDIPDKFEVWLGGVKRIDTGYVGGTSEQSALDAELDSRGLPPETITQRTGTGSIASDWSNPAMRDRASFYKEVGDSVATVRVYGPMEGTLWRFALSCPDDAEPPP